MRQHSGARQWRHQCSCAPGDPDEPGELKDWRMHSQVSESNLEYFIEEDRVGPSMELEDLATIHREADGSVIVCNNCRTVKVVGS